MRISDRDAILLLVPPNFSAKQYLLLEFLQHHIWCCWLMLHGNRLDRWEKQRWLLHLVDGLAHVMVWPSSDACRCLLIQHVSSLQSNPTTGKTPTESKGASRSWYTLGLRTSQFKSSPLEL